MSRLAVVLLVFTVALAGCASSGGGGKKGPDEVEVPTLTSTKTTGVIRAIAIDEAIRPLAGALVAIRGSSPQEGTTNTDGFVGFEGLARGTYVLDASLPGYGPVTQTVDVVAGVDDPPIVKFLLARLAGERPFYEERMYEGFLQCAAGAAGGSANVCFIANFYPCLVAQTAGQPCPANATSDRSYFPVPFFGDHGRAPDWTQVELVWDSTQAVSESLMLRVNVDDDATPIDHSRSAKGPSPVLVSLNQTTAQEWELGTNRSLSLEVFTSSSAGADAAGLALNQQIRYFVHAFYGYTPPEGWRFTDGPAPPPPY